MALMTNSHAWWPRRWRPLALAVTLLLGACQATRQPEPSPAQLPERRFTLVLPIYDDGLTQALTTLKPHLRREDRFMLVSGNNSGAIDTPWLNRAALELRTAYPHTRLYVATSGLAKFKQAVLHAGELVEAVVYVYEPNFPNQPEFSWAFDETLARFSEASAEARRHGFRAVGKPTGRPLLQSNLANYRWNYGVLAGTVDELLIQTQTYCEDSVEVFTQAIDELATQYQAHGRTPPWFPQVTVDPEAPNGTSVAQARACLTEARARGVRGAVLWWSPSSVGRTVAFMQALNRGP